MSTTLAQYKTRLAELGFSQVTDATALTSAINAGRRFVYRHRTDWSFMTKTSTALSTTANQLTVDLSSLTTLLSVQGVRSDGNWIAQPNPASYLRELDFRDAGSGTPCDFAIEGTSLLLWPRPDKVYPLTIEYQAQPVALAGDSDTDAFFPDLFMDAIAWAAAYELAFRQRDYNSVNYAKAERNDELNRMASNPALVRRKTLRVAHSDWWDDAAQ